MSIFTLHPQRLQLRNVVLSNLIENEQRAASQAHAQCRVMCEAHAQCRVMSYFGAGCAGALELEAVPMTGMRVGRCQRRMEP